MTPQTRMEGIIHRYFELWETQNADGLGEIFAKDATYVVRPFGEEVYTGLTDIEGYWRDNTVKNQTNPKTRVLSVAYNADTAFVEWETTYTNPQGIKKIMRGMLNLAFENGYIKELHEHFNTNLVA